MRYRIRLDVYWQGEYTEDLLAGSQHDSLEEAEAAFFNLFIHCSTTDRHYRIYLFMEEDEMKHLLKKAVVGKVKGD